VTSTTYWTTREAAATCGLTDTMLRWYERIGLLDRVERGHDRRRRFTRSDLDWLRLLSMLRATGMPVREMQRYADLLRRCDTEAERLELLEAHRERIVAALAVQRECLALMDSKIDHYRQGRSTGHPAGSPGTKENT
jgi:DNA-binding transcriptional MerR regulator